MKLSLCIATHNEEKNIHYPLDSAYDLVDEVIIVDGSSTDKTVEIAKSYGKKVKVFIKDNPLMFHINKQKAIERARGDWILQLDADEILSEELKKEIINVERSTFNVKYVAFWIPRKNYFLGRFLMKGGQYPDYTIRLYRNGYARFPCKDVHENVEIIQNQKSMDSTMLTIDPERKSNGSKIKNQNYSLKIKNYDIKNSLEIKNFKLKIGYLKNPILHYADPTFSRYLMRWHRYNTLEANNLANIQYPISNIKKILLFIKYLIIKPPVTFFLMYFRHLGLLDGFSGLVFAFFSSIRFWEIYFKLLYARSRILKKSK